MLQITTSKLHNLYNKFLFDVNIIDEIITVNRIAGFILLWMALSFVSQENHNSTLLIEKEMGFDILLFSVISAFCGGGLLFMVNSGFIEHQWLKWLLLSPLIYYVVIIILLGLSGSLPQVTAGMYVALILLVIKGWRLNFITYTNSRKEKEKIIKAVAGDDKIYSIEELEAAMN